MIKDITLGQYFPGNSPVHRMNPTVKILVAIAYIVAVFMAKNVFAFAMLTVSSLLVVLISSISVKTVMKSIKPIVFVLIFTMILNIFFVKGETELFRIFRVTIYLESIYHAGLMALRVVMVVVVTSVMLTYTTSPFALTDGLEVLLTPLKIVKVPVHDLSMMMTIALRFIPVLIEETDKIMNAQKARGADFSSGSIFKRAKALIPVLIPLFVSAFNRAGDLSVAMECRCYRSGIGATKMNKRRIGPVDLLSVIAVAAIIIGVVMINRYVKIGYSI